MMFHDDYKLQPVTAAEVKEAETIRGMRERLNRYSRYNPLVKAVYDQAWVQGLSGEDCMTLLAYHALIHNEKLMEMQLEDLIRRPMQFRNFTTST